MPWEEVTVNIHGDTAQQFVMPAGWRAEYDRYLDEHKWQCKHCGAWNYTVLTCHICKKDRTL